MIPACRRRRAGRGRLAQRLEHAVHIRGVTGSNPVSPTNPRALIRTDRRVDDLRSSVTYVVSTLLPRVGGLALGAAECASDPADLGRRAADRPRDTDPTSGPSCSLPLS